jgi:hypothetical protein
VRQDFEFQEFAPAPFASLRGQFGVTHTAFLKSMAELKGGQVRSALSILVCHTAFLDLWDELTAIVRCDGHRFPQAMADLKGGQVGLSLSILVCHTALVMLNIPSRVWFGVTPPPLSSSPWPTSRAGR